ncbi:MAG: hypothetical protein K2H09_09240 [Treponemataceae bacterium]|nr:hypothetical protein [Treponemataceae bacterium]
MCFIKNIITRKNIIVGDYTYYDDKNGADAFEDHVTPIQGTADMNKALGSN